MRVRVTSNEAGKRRWAAEAGREYVVLSLESKFSAASGMFMWLADHMNHCRYRRIAWRS
jgi:hypothetical protein